MDNFWLFLDHLLDTEQFDEARTIVRNMMNESGDETSDNNLLLQAKLHMLLIDIGCNSYNQNDIVDAISFLERNEKRLESAMTKSSFFYNLANAKHGLDQIFYYNHRGVHPLSTVKERFQQAVNLYWQAHKASSSSDSQMHAQILINLANSLVYVSRYVECIHFLDTVLEQFPMFPQALVAKAENLYCLTQVSNCAVSVALYAEIYYLFTNAISTKALPPSVLERCKQQQINIANILMGYEFNIEDVQTEIKIAREEYTRHSNFRKFCIDHSLTLNEHGIYCKCSAVAKDDLQIGVAHASFKGKSVPKLELLLNRIKSEFSFARWLYYKSLTEDPFDYDVMFSELLDGEVINSQSELLRTSFRKCYSILDKIALGICKLYDLDSNRILFESFWFDSKRKEVLNNKRNIHLIALFSVANDLNTKTGELKHFKDWRNKLEHNLLVLKSTKDYILDPLNIFEDKDFVTVVDIEEFKEKTLHLLQLTRAAIFSYVYCVRLQTIQEKQANGDSPYFTVGYKQS